MRHQLASICWLMFHCMLRISDHRAWEAAFGLKAFVSLAYLRSALTADIETRRPMRTLALVARTIADETRRSETFFGVIGKHPARVPPNVEPSHVRLSGAPKASPEPINAVSKRQVRLWSATPGIEATAPPNGRCSWVPAWRSAPTGMTRGRNWSASAHISPSAPEQPRILGFVPDRREIAPERRRSQVVEAGVLARARDLGHRGQ